MMNTTERKPITVHLLPEALDKLTDWSKDLSKQVDKKRAVSPGKIVEALLLKDDVDTYIQEVLGTK